MENDEYFEYLAGRGRLGLLYRRWFLYPRLCRHLEGRVLDVGCGIGDMVAFRPNTVGVDINLRSVEWCRGRGLEVYPMEPDRLPFGEASFDGVVLDNVLEHIKEPGPLLAEIRRVTRAGGRLIVGVPGERGYATDETHARYYDVSLLLNTMRKAGWTCKAILHLPIQGLGRWLTQYCIYGVFDRS